MFDHILRIGATLAAAFFIMSLDSIPTWVLLWVAFACAVAFIYEIIAVEEHLHKDDLPDTDTPIAHQVAQAQNFDLSTLDRLDRDADFRRNFDKEL